MNEKILFESKIIESEEFDAISTPSTVTRVGQPTMGTPTPTNTQQSTVTTDIASQAPYVGLAQNAISMSLPYMISFVQPLSTSDGYVFGLQQKDRTVIPAQPSGDDIVVLRRYVKTDVREVTLDLTNETAEDIQNLFGNNFKENYKEFIQTGGEVWNGQNGPLAKFFLSLARQRIVSKINKDFTEWISTVATNKSVTPTSINAWAEMDKLVGVISELREALYKSSKKSGQYWIMVSPRIAAFLSTYYGRQHNSADAFTKGRRIPQNTQNGYVTTIGDIEVYQYNFDIAEDAGKIYMGYTGNAGTASIYYTPYNEYIVQGGEDYFTGQSNVFYRVRDKWEVNPLDTQNKTLTGTVVPEATNNSDFVVSADITFTQRLINS